MYAEPFWGGLRVGWVRAPGVMIARLAAVRPSPDLGTPVLEQLITARLLEQADSVLASRRETLRARRAALLEEMRLMLPDWRPGRPQGGLSLWCELPKPAGTALATMGEPYGVRVAAGPWFGVDDAFERFLRLPHTLPEMQLREGVRRLAAVQHAVLSSPPIRMDDAAIPVL